MQRGSPGVWLGWSWGSHSGERHFTMHWPMTNHMWVASYIEYGEWLYPKKEKKRQERRRRNKIVCRCQFVMVPGMKPCHQNSTQWALTLGWSCLEVYFPETTCSSTCRLSRCRVYNICTVSPFYSTDVHLEDWRTLSLLLTTLCMWPDVTHLRFGLQPSSVP